MVRSMARHIKKDFKQAWRENIFYSRCIIMNITYTLNIDEGSCTNVASQTMLEKLKLSTIPYSKP